MTFGDANGFLCVYIGRISREKRLDVIIEALKPLENVYLAIIGRSVTDISCCQCEYVFSFVKVTALVQIIMHRCMENLIEYTAPLRFLVMTNLQK